MGGPGGMGGMGAPPPMPQTEASAKNKRGLSVVIPNGQKVPHDLALALVSFDLLHTTIGQACHMLPRNPARPHLHRSLRSLLYRINLVVLRSTRCLLHHPSAFRPSVCPKSFVYHDTLHCISSFGMRQTSGFSSYHPVLHSFLGSVHELTHRPPEI